MFFDTVIAINVIVRRLNWKTLTLERQWGFRFQTLE